MPPLHINGVMHGFPFPVDRLSISEPPELSSPPFDFTSPQLPFAYIAAEESPLPATHDSLFSPIPLPFLYPSEFAPSHHVAAAAVPPLLPSSTSLFPSMSAADHTSYDRERDIDLFDLQQQQTAPVTPTQPATNNTTHWPVDNSVPSFSSPSAASSASSSSVSPTPQSKQCREQRQLRKRLKQRRADSHRRQRETTALNTMKRQLNTAAAQQLTNSTHTDTTDDATLHTTHHRVQILESGAKRMAELQLLVDLLSHTCAAQQRQIHALSHRHDTPDTNGDPHTSAAQPFSLFQHDTRPSISSATVPSKRVRLLASTIDRCVGHASLQSARLLPVVLASMLVECASGLVLDVNDGMVVQGWQRSQLVGRTVMESYEAVMDEKGWQLGENEEQRLLVPSSVDGQLRPAGRPVQYERSKRLMRELYAGTIGVCVAVWRVHLSDGLEYEVQTSTWIDGWDSAIDATGRLSQRPHRAVSVTSLGDCRRVE